MTEQTRQEKSNLTRMRNYINKEFADNGWGYRGIEFQKYVWLGKGDIKFCCCFSCNLTYVKAYIEGGYQYQLADRAQTFTDDNAMEDCLEWTAKNLMEMVETVEGRFPKANRAYREYQRALRGE